MIFGSYTKRHYLKDVRKKYSRRVQEAMLEAIEGVLRNPEVAIEREKIDTITNQSSKIIGKLEIKIPGQNMSAKSGGWRGVVLINTEKIVVHVLLVYSKDHVKGSHETDWWKAEIKRAYPEIGKLL